jgi:hypothetical protein
MVHAGELLHVGFAERASALVARHRLAAGLHAQVKGGENDSPGARNEALGALTSHVTIDHGTLDIRFTCRDFEIERFPPSADDYR